jgi:hypothetical protein
MSTRATIKSSHWIKTQPSESDRRLRQRMTSTAIGYLVNEDAICKTDPWEVRIHDVSRHGVGFVTSEQMSPGAICHIRIGHGPMRLARRMRVVSCKSESQNIFRVGAEFA